MKIGYPTMASAPHIVINEFKNLLAISLETNVTFEETGYWKVIVKYVGRCFVFIKV